MRKALTQLGRYWPVFACAALILAIGAAWTMVETRPPAATVRTPLGYTDFGLWPGYVDIHVVPNRVMGRVFDSKEWGFRTFFYDATSQPAREQTTNAMSRLTPRKVVHEGAVYRNYFLRYPDAMIYLAILGLGLWSWIRRRIRLMENREVGASGVRENPKPE